MANLPPSMPPWSQPSPSPPPVGQPAFGAPPQQAAFTNPVIGSVPANLGGIPESLRSLFPGAPQNRRSIREAPISVLAVVAALLGQAIFTMVIVVFLAAAGGVVKGISELQSEFGSSSSGASEGEFMLVAGSMLLFLVVISVIMVAFKLFGGSWKAWFGAIAVQGFYLLIGLYMVIEASGTWVIGLLGPIAIAGLLMLPDARAWVASESDPH